MNIDYLDYDEYIDLEPADDDYTISDCGPLGSLYQVSGLPGTFRDWNAAIVAIQHHMDAEQSWPGVWYRNDHGNVDSVNIND